MQAPHSLTPGCFLNDVPLDKPDLLVLFLISLILSQCLLFAPLKVCILRAPKACLRHLVVPFQAISLLLHRNQLDLLCLQLVLQRNTTTLRTCPSLESKKTTSFYSSIIVFKYSVETHIVCKTISKFHPRLAQSKNVHGIIADLEFSNSTINPSNLPQPALCLCSSSLTFDSSSLCTSEPPPSENPLGVVKTGASTTTITHIQFEGPLGHRTLQKHARRAYTCAYSVYIHLVLYISIHLHIKVYEVHSDLVSLELSFLEIRDGGSSTPWNK